MNNTDPYGVTLGVQSIMGNFVKNKKAPLSVRSFLGLQSLHFIFSESTFPVKNYTNQRTKNLFYQKFCLFNVFYGFFHNMMSQSEVLYVLIYIRLIGNHKRAGMFGYSCICHYHL